MTETDLITVGENTDDTELTNAVTTDTPDVKATAATVSLGSLSTMVLPELRALANQAGVKGTSGMRKSELIAAIEECRGQANGTSVNDGPSRDHGGSATAISTEALAAQEEQNYAIVEVSRRERRGASREADVTAGTSTAEATESD